jgi:hypothetical protein
VMGLYRVEGGQGEGSLVPGPLVRMWVLVGVIFGPSALFSLGRPDTRGIVNRMLA